MITVEVPSRPIAELRSALVEASRVRSKDGLKIWVFLEEVMVPMEGNYKVGARREPLEVGVDLDLIDLVRTDGPMKKKASVLGAFTDEEFGKYLERNPIHVDSFKLVNGEVLYFVRDGNHRVSRSEEMGLQSLPVNVMDCYVTDAQNQSYIISKIEDAAAMPHTGLVFKADHMDNYTDYVWFYGNDGSIRYGIAVPQVFRGEKREVLADLLLATGAREVIIP